MLAWIFSHTGRLPSEILALPPGERAICMMGAQKAMVDEAKLMAVRTISSALTGGKRP